MQLEDLLPARCTSWRQALLRALPALASHPQTPSPLLFPRSRNMANPKTKVIFDTDVGVDDAVALLSLLKSRNCEVQAITTVDGNASLQNVTENVRTLLSVEYEKFGHIPLFAGAKGPIVQPEGFKKYFWDGHGPDGMGGGRAPYTTELADKIAKVQVQDEHAAMAMIRMCKATRGMTIIAVGPLTNVALAIRLDPDFLSYIDRLYVMGGSLLAKGNASRTAEFNFACDPEAAQIVFTSSTKHSIDQANPKVVLATWELCLENAFEWDLIDELCARRAAASSPWPQFLHRITGSLRSIFRSEKHMAAIAQANGVKPPRHDVHVPDFRVGRLDTTESHYVAICDSCATFPLTIPEAVERSVPLHVEIELSGAQTRGMMCLQWAECADERKLANNCTIITHLNHDVLVAELKRIFSDDA
ncbi:Uridine nucleosidase 1 [Blastocladiella emersonii ATCC 22665]|nr:Uridine nucleosidase 1 [Blastocladiella emersonii ATCC 22665]